MIEASVFVNLASRTLGVIHARISAEGPVRGQLSQSHDGVAAEGEVAA